MFLRGYGMDGPSGGVVLIQSVSQLVLSSVQNQLNNGIWRI